MHKNTQTPKSNLVHVCFSEVGFPGKCNQFQNLLFHFNTWDRSADGEMKLVHTLVTKKEWENTLGHYSKAQPSAQYLGCL